MQGLLLFRLRPLPLFPCGTLPRPIVNLRFRILAAFALALGLVALANVLDQWRLAEARIDATVAGLSRQAHRAAEERVGNETRHLETLAREVMDHPAWAVAMRGADRDTLYTLAAPLFAAWQRDLGITHFYFHRPDGSNLLRVHLRERHGDRIKRRSLQAAMATGHSASRIEIGLTGEWVLRVVVPWHDAGRLLGYVELGMDMEGIYHSSLAPLGIDYLAMTFKRAIPDPAVWEARHRALGF